MKSKCMVIDNDITTLNRLKEYMFRLPNVEVVDSFLNPLEALKRLQETESPDILFLDIDMPELSGLDLIKVLDPHIAVVFITGYREYALEAYDQHALDYLLKPITFDKFYHCIKRVQDLKTPQQREKFTEFIYVSSDKKGKHIKVTLNDIIYIESALNYIIIHFSNKSIITYLTLTEIQEILPNDCFYRIHKSFIVNVRKIEVVESDELTLSNGKQITVGRTYKTILMKHIDASIIKSKRRN